MIKTLRLRNFKKHEALDLSFTQGLNLITGPNWAGKTTVLSGIMFALGGSSQVPGPAPQRRGTNTGFEVEMDFLVGGVEHTVSRKKTSANLWRGKELIASGTNPVNTAIEELLGMSVRRFRQLRYAEQKETHALLTLGATELHKILDEITKAEDVTHAINHLQTIILVERATHAAIPEEDLEGLKIRLGETVAGLRSAEAEISSSGQLMASLAIERSQLSSFLSRARRRAEEFRMLERKRAALSAEISTLRAESVRRQAEVKALGEAPSEAGLLRREADLEVLEKQEKAYERALISSQHEQAELKRLSKLREEAEAALQPLERAYAAADSEYDHEAAAELQRKYDAAGAARGELEGRVKRATAAVADSICGSCKRPFGESDLELLQQDLDEARDLLGKSTTDLNALGAKLATAARALNNLQVAKATFEKAKAKLESVEADISRVRAAMVGPIEAEDYSFLPKLRKDLADARVKLREHLRATSGLTRLNSDLEEAVARLKEAEAASDALEYVPEALTEAEDRERQLAREAAQLEITLKAAKETQMRLSGDEERLSLELEAGEVRQARRAAALARETIAKTLQKFLRDSRDRYAAQVWSHFMAAASDFASTCTDGQIDEIRRTEDGKFTYMEDGHEMQVKEASGAQAAIMGLSVQMALAESAGCPLDILLVDEPTADMSPENSMATSAMLASLGKQVVAISHSPYDSSVCSNQLVLGAEI